MMVSMFPTIEAIAAISGTTDADRITLVAKRVEFEALDAFKAVARPAAGTAPTTPEWEPKAEEASATQMTAGLFAIAAVVASLY